MQGPFNRFSDILNQLRRRYPTLGKRIDEAGAIQRWEEAVGPHIARHARAICVKDSVLWVEVDHPIWRSELHHRKRQILEILNRKPGQGESESEKPLVVDILLLDPRQTAGNSTYTRGKPGAGAFKKPDGR